MHSPHPGVDLRGVGRGLGCGGRPLPRAGLRGGWRLWAVRSWGLVVIRTAGGRVGCRSRRGTRRLLLWLLWLRRRLLLVRLLLLVWLLLVGLLLLLSWLGLLWMVLVGRGRRVHGGQLGATVRVGICGSTRGIILWLSLGRGRASCLRADQTVGWTCRVASHRGMAQSLSHVVVAILRGQVVAATAAAGRASRRRVRVTVGRCIASVRTPRLVIVPAYMVPTASVRYSLVITSRERVDKIGAHLALWFTCAWRSAVGSCLCPDELWSCWSAVRFYNPKETLTHIWSSGRTHVIGATNQRAQPVKPRLNTSDWYKA